MVGLHVEYEIVHLPVRSSRRRLCPLCCFHSEKAAEDVVHGCERGGHAPGRAQVLPPLNPQLFGVAAHYVEQMVLDGFLLPGLGERVVLLVRHHLGRYWLMAVQVIIQIAFVYPPTLPHRLGWAGYSFRIA